MSLKSVRLLVALVLALVVPLQGIAAAAAGVCMATGHHGAAMAADDGHADGHADSHSHDAHSESLPEQGPEMDHSSTSTGEGHCGPCVACCAAAAISSFSPLLLPEFAHGFAIAAIPASFSGVQPETLDRPPLAL